jgi:anti-anti-sigma regulatory factor
VPTSLKNTDLTISVAGHFDMELFNSFKATYVDKPAKNHIIDMSATDNLDPSALGLLISMRKTLGKDTKISIVNCCAAIKEMFLMAKFDKKFNIE